MKHFLITIFILSLGYQASASLTCDKNYLVIDIAQLKDYTKKNDKAFKEFKEYVDVIEGLEKEPEANKVEIKKRKSELEHKIAKYLGRKINIRDNYGFGQDRITYNNGDAFFRLHQIIDYFGQCGNSEDKKVQYQIKKLRAALEADAKVQGRILALATKWGTAADKGDLVHLMYQEQEQSRYMRDFRSAVSPQADNR